MKLTHIIIYTFLTLFSYQSYSQNQVKNFNVTDKFKLETDTILYMLEMSNYLDTTYLSRYEEDILKFEKEDSLKGFKEGKILFLGSSSIRKWFSLKEDMFPIPVMNRGFGGSTLPEAIYYFNRIAIPYKPSAIVLYEGDNDITAPFLTPEVVLKMFKLFVRLTEKYLPNTHIYFLSIKPSPAREQFVDKLLITNMLIKEECNKKANLNFINISDAMYNNDGELKEDIFNKDKLHMNKKGYDIWKKIIKNALLKDL